MSQVYVTHGVAPDAEPTRFHSRFRSDPTAFSRLLARQEFVTLAEAMKGEGDALTVDDATVASADLCRMARASGCPVVLFVNPGQVESGRPYYFMLLNALCEQLDRTEYDFEGKSFSTTTFRQRLALRNAIKDRVSVLPEETARSDAIVDLAQRWRVGPLTLPAHARTLTVPELRDLIEAGVELHNHGWWHANHLALTPEASAREVRRGRDWLRDTFGLAADYFAVPFGEPMPSPEAARFCSVWFTLTGPPHGAVGPAVWNRTDLTLYREEPTAHVLPSPSSLAGRVIAKLTGLFRFRRLRFQIARDDRVAVSGSANSALMQPEG